MHQVGDRWTFLILREAFFGVRRFVELQNNLGVARNILSGRLSRLVDNGLLVKSTYCLRPRRDEYRLTEKGRDLYGVTVALMRWGDRWAAPSEPPPLRLAHAEDGGDIEQVLRCTVCHQDLTVRDVNYEYPGPD